MISNISVFCASSQKVDPVYLQAAFELGQLFSHHGIHVFYGGGAVGLMGRLADGVMKGGGKITGIIPQFMLDQGWGHPGIQHIVVQDIHERKKKLAENADALVALPGGVGTMEELLEMITLKQLGQIFSPIVIVNINAFFDPLLKLFDQMIKQHFMREIHKNIWTVIQKPAHAIDAIRDAPGWDGSAIKYAPA
ncbi:MAG: lysine decarboxylase [Bacteroides sp. SM23_62_1]|nr:MAG: lysine decarboxylase [Bacteroides sp. SM23_62_1]